MELKKAIEVVRNIDTTDIHCKNCVLEEKDKCITDLFGYSCQRIAINTVLEELDNYKLFIKSAKRFIEDNSHEFICKRDGGLPELEFDNNTNASDLLDILDGNY